MSCDINGRIVPSSAIFYTIYFVYMNQKLGFFCMICLYFVAFAPTQLSNNQTNPS